MKKTSFTRQELYDLVWSEPLSQIAKRYDISDNGLRKKCKQFNIPTPEIGYWQKLQYNKVVIKKKLPKEDPTDGKEIFLLSRTEDTNPQHTARSKIIQLKKSYSILDQRYFKVKTKLSNPDALIRDAQQTLKNGQEGAWSTGLVHTNFNQISINASPSNINRALRIMDCLIKLLKYRGHHIIIEDNKTYVLIEKERIEIAIREKLNQNRTTDDYGWARTVYTPSGLLVLRVGWLVKKEYIDGSRLLEDRIADFLAYIEHRGQEEKEARIQREIQHKRWEEEQRLRKEQAERRNKEINSVKNLFSESQLWDRSTILYGYINEIEKRANENGTLTEELKTWLAWAKQKADWYNPFIKKKDDILNDNDRKLF